MFAVLFMRMFACFSCLALALLLVAAPTFAQEPAPSEYEIVLAQSLEAHARGDYEAARVAMERAHAIEPSARTLRGLGIVAFAQGKHLSAIRYLDGSLASEVKPLPSDLRASVQELLTNAWAQVGRYEVVIDPASGDFLIDGAEPDFYAPSVVVLVPGPHVVTARAPARAPYELKLEARAGARETLHLVLAVPPAPLVVERRVESLSPLAVPPAARPTWWTPALRNTGLAGGTVLFFGGAALYWVGVQKLDDIADGCRSRPEGACTSEQADRRFDARNVRAYGISGGVLAGTGAALLLGVGAIEIWRLRHKEKPRSIVVSFDSLSLAGSF